MYCEVTSTRTFDPALSRLLGYSFTTGEDLRHKHSNSIHNGE